MIATILLAVLETYTVIAAAAFLGLLWLFLASRAAGVFGYVNKPPRIILIGLAIIGGIGWPGVLLSLRRDRSPMRSFAKSWLVSRFRPRP